MALTKTSVPVNDLTPVGDALPTGKPKQRTRKTKIQATIGKPTLETEKKWINEQIAYENFAGKNEDLDNRAAALVKQHCNDYRNRMSAVFDRWAINWRGANGDVPWLKTMDGIHVYEPQKRLRSKCARIVRSIRQFDPPFVVEGGNSEVDRREAETIGMWVHRKLEDAKWEDLQGPVARSGELTNLLAGKVTYEHQPEFIVDRDCKFNTQTQEWENTRTISRKIGRKGSRIDQVDSFWFFYDLTAKDAQECSFIGDESEPFLHELLHLSDLGIYEKKQLEKVGTERRTQTPTAKDIGSNWVDAHRNARSVALGNDTAGAQPITQNQHEAVRVRLVEDWCLFNFGPNGFDNATDPTSGEKLTGVHKVVITLADDVVIRFQLNPHDDKHVPYAFEWVENNGAGAFAPAPFDAVLQQSMDYDRFATSVGRWVDTLTTPFIATKDQASGWPSSMLGVKTGTVIRNAGEFEVIRQPDLTPAVTAIRGMHRQEIEESSGDMRVYESPSGTATETERKVQESQLLVQASIDANCKFWAQIGLLIQRTEAQYATAEQTFAAVGKAAASVNPFVTITPDTMLKDVRFRVYGMHNVHVLGTRAAGMGRWSTRWAPMLPQMPKIDLYELAKMDFELEVGNFGMERIFPGSTSPLDVATQDQENVWLAAGHSVDVNDQDDHVDHMKKIVAFLQTPNLPPYVVKKTVEHYNEHAIAQQKKMAEQKQAEQEAKDEAAIMGPQGGKPGQDRPPAYGGMPAQTQQNVTPGGFQDRTVAKTGRDQPSNQNELMTA